MRKHLFFILFLLPLLLIAQQTLTGTVTDNNKFPLPGASILVKGTVKGAVTNIDGEFAIQLDETPATLVVSFLGFTSKEIVVNQETQISVVLFL